MLNSFSLNRYIHRKSLIHESHPIGKLLSLLLLLIVSVMSNNLYIHIILMSYIVIMIFLTNISIVQYIKSIKQLRYLLIGIFFINFIFKTDMIINMIQLMRIIEIVLYTSIITATTSEAGLLASLNTFLRPFKLLKVETNKISFILLLSIKFIPSVLEQTDKIVKTLASKGASFHRMKDKVLLIKSITIPTIYLSLKKADTFAESLEIRQYDINHIKHFEYQKWTVLNSIVIVVLLCLLVMEVIL